MSQRRSIRRGGLSRGRARVPRAAVETGLAVVLATGATALLLAAPRLVAVPARAQPGAFPPYVILWVGAGLLAVAATAWLVAAVRALRGRDGETLDVREWGEVGVLLLLFAAGQQLARLLGLVLAAAFVYVALLVVYGERGWRFVALSCAAYVIVIQVVFVELLRIPLPRSPYLPLPL